MIHHWCVRIVYTHTYIHDQAAGPIVIYTVRDRESTVKTTIGMVNMVDYGLE
jgi:hypothetical protein